MKQLDPACIVPALGNNSYLMLKVLNVSADIAVAVFRVMLLACSKVMSSDWKMNACLVEM
jgi:predicted transcriptional regulator